MSLTLYSAQTPSLPNETDNTYNLSAEFEVSRDAYAIAGRRYGSSSTPSVTVHHHLWSVTGPVKLADVAYGAHVPGAWNTAAFSAPVALTAGARYATAYGPTNGYVATLGLLPLTNGPITGHGSRFITAGDTVAYPNSSLGTAGYFADIVIGDLKTGELTTALGGASVRVVGTRTGEIIPTEATPSGWYGLIAILREGEAILQEEMTRPELDCPECGWPLSTGPAGLRYCPHGDYGPRPA